MLCLKKRGVWSPHLAAMLRVLGKYYIQRTYNEVSGARRKVKSEKKRKPPQHMYVTSDEDAVALVGSAQKRAGFAFHGRGRTRPRVTDGSNIQVQRN